jgi:hypothetical protein
MSGSFAMPRQPFRKKYPSGGMALGPGFLSQRPKAAAAIAECIATWTEIELQIGRALAGALGAKAEPVIALYLSLQNERAKRECLEAIAEYVFSSHERELLDLIMIAKNSFASERNALAHGLFGITEASPDGILWVETKHRIKNWLDAEKAGEDPRKKAAVWREIGSKAFIYELVDLQNLLTDLQEFHKVVWSFAGYLSIDDRSTKAAGELCQRILKTPLLDRFRSPT